MLGDVGIVDPQKAGKQGSIKQFCVQSHPTYLFVLKICKGGLQLSLHLLIFLLTSFSSMLELNFAIYHRVCLHRLPQ